MFPDRLLEDFTDDDLSPEDHACCSSEMSPSEMRQHAGHAMGANSLTRSRSENWGKPTYISTMPDANQINIKMPTATPR